MNGAPPDPTKSAREPDAFARLQLTQAQQRAQYAIAWERAWPGFARILSVVGLFLVFNALSVTVAERRHEIGILLALGATRDQVRRLFAGEAVVLGPFFPAEFVEVAFIYKNGVILEYMQYRNLDHWFGQPNPPEFHHEPLTE